MSLSSLFVSHSSKDGFVAAAIGQRLRAEGYRDLFLDFDPERGIPAGRRWEREIYSQLRRVDGVIFLASPTSVESKWCFAELTIARLLGKPVFPLRLEGTARLGLLDDVQWIDLNNSDDAFTRLWEGLRRAGFDSQDAFAWDPSRSPYPGLQAFSPEDAAVFFGRAEKIDELMDRLRSFTRGASQIVTVVGPSGSGKSSLVRAGLLPRLARLPDRWVVLSPMLPGSSPAANLARSFARALPTAEPPTTAEVEQRLASPTGLVELVAEVLDGRRGDPNLLVVIDQAEELITRTGEKEQHAFLGLMHEALKMESRLRVVATLRSEFLSRAPERAGLTEEAHAVIVEPLSRARLPEVIVKPAQRAGIDFEPGLVERMVEDTVGGDALPLLAYTLQELYSRRDGTEGTVTATDYEDIGGVTGALQRHADHIMAELARQGHGDLVLPTLIKLAAVSNSGEVTRRRVPWQNLNADEATVVQGFIDGWLLISKSDAHQDNTVEVAHEALLRQWPPLRDKIDELLHSLQVRSELDRLAVDWDRRGRGNEDEQSYLVRGGRLDDFLRWAEDNPTEVDEVQRSFLRASQESVAAEAAAQALAEAEAMRKQYRDRVLRSIVVLSCSYKSGMGRVPSLPPRKLPLVNWSRANRKLTRHFSWYLAFPFTLLNVAGFMEPEDKRARRVMRLAVGVASLCLTVAMAAWMTVILETVWRAVYSDGDYQYNNDNDWLTGVMLQAVGPGILILFIVYRMVVGRALVDRGGALISVASIAVLVGMIVYLHTKPAFRNPRSDRYNPIDPMTPIVAYTTGIVGLIALGFCIYALRKRRNRAGFAGAALLLVLAVTSLNAAGSILRLFTQGLLGYMLPNEFTGMDYVLLPAPIHAPQSILGAPLDRQLSRLPLSNPGWPTDLGIDLIPAFFVVMVMIFGVIVWLVEVMREITIDKRRTSAVTSRRRAAQSTPLHKTNGDRDRPKQLSEPDAETKPVSRAHSLVDQLPQYLAPAVITGIIATGLVWIALIYVLSQTSQSVMNIVLIGPMIIGGVATVLIIRRPKQLADRLRRTLGLIADIAGFWAPDLHPLAGASYRRRLLSGIRQAINDLVLDYDEPIALVGDSQGSVVCAWFIRGGHWTERPTEGKTDRKALKERLYDREGKEGKPSNRIALFTCGSPLDSLCRTYFPRYFDDDFFETARWMAYESSHWRNYWRKTDPVGTPLPIPRKDNVDVTELKDEETLGHSEYWRDPRLRADVIGFLATAQTQRGEERTSHRLRRVPISN